MINNKIKTKAQVKKVAKECAKDLREVLDIYQNYQVVVRETNEVVIKSDITCAILTESMIETALKVIEWYKVKYLGVSYCFDVIKGQNGYIPAIRIEFRISE